MLGKYIEEVRNNTPLVHNITNYVTVNDVANVLLACGGSPIMSDEPEDVEDITSICQGLNINIGTLNKRTIESMFIAGKRANKLGHTVLLDPVGAGASVLRTNIAVELMNKIESEYNRVDWQSEASESFKARFEKLKNDILSAFDNINNEFSKLMTQTQEDIENTEKSNTVQ